MTIGQTIRHSAEAATGATKRFVGRLTGNRRMAASGRAKVNMHQAMDKVRNAFKR